MKNILSIFAILFTVLVSAQVPQGVSYQAIALNGSGNPVVSSNVGIRLSLLDNSATGTIIYTETHVKMTNPQGLFNLVIGQGTPTAGTFATINWALNSKFLKVEMDVAGETNYALVGTTQLLSVPYALASKSLTLGAGEGITLTSPNGTQYTLGVNDAGQLTLPSSGNIANYPATFYMYGSFNSYDPFSALLLSSADVMMGLAKYGYKYLTAGTEIKFISANNASGVIYGINNDDRIILNGSSYTVPSNAFYFIYMSHGFEPGNELYYLEPTSISPTIGNPGIAPTYNVATNTFTFIVNNITSSNSTFTFNIPSPTISTYGDYLADGSIDNNGTAITYPNTTSSPKSYKVELVINFNGSGNYVITEL